MTLLPLKASLGFKRTPLRRLIKNKEGAIVGITGWGSFTCMFCNQRVVAYNDERHRRSKKHKDNIKSYEKINNVIVFEDIDNITEKEFDEKISNHAESRR